MAAGAQLALPLGPISTTLQTFAMLLVGFFAGPRIAMTAMLVYLALVLGGLPVLSSGQSYGGRAFFQFIAAGYVVGFIPGAGLAGWLGGSGGIGRLLAAGIVSHLVVLACGVPVVAYWRGWTAALEIGFLPFLAGAILKSLAAAVIVTIVRRKWAPNAD